MSHTQPDGQPATAGENQTPPEPEGHCEVCGVDVYDEYVGVSVGVVCLDRDCLIEALQNEVMMNDN